MKNESKNTFPLPSAPGLRPCLARGWCLRPGLELAHLADPQQIELLYAVAVEAGCFEESEVSRRLFWGLCHKTRRKAAGMKNPIGCLHWALKGGLTRLASQVPDDPDGQWATRAIREFDGGPIEAVQPRSPPAKAMRPVDEFRLQQQRELQRMQAEFERTRTLAPLQPVEAPP